MLYNKYLEGLKDKVVILKMGEDDNNSWLDNMEVLHGTILGDPHQNIGEKKPIMTHLVPNNYQKPLPLLLHQFSKTVRTKAWRTYTQLTHSNFTSILNNTDEGPNDLEPKEVINPKVKEVVI